MTDVPVPQLVQELGATLAIDAVAKKIRFPPEAIARARGQVTLVDTPEQKLDLAAHLVALGQSIHQHKRTLADGEALESLATLVVALLGDAALARDAFAASGLTDAAASLGNKTELTAPKAEDQKRSTGPAVKAVRGLRK